MLDTIEEAVIQFRRPPPELAGDIIERMMVTGDMPWLMGLTVYAFWKLRPVMIAEPLQSVKIGTGILLNRIKSERGILLQFVEFFKVKKVE